ncbi:MAG: hypothetical protein NTX52_05260 [Planctomycetota bacterium]|nr:hypothetical protein [Planctomycetota bacterium]
MSELEQRKINAEILKITDEMLEGRTLYNVIDDPETDAYDAVLHLHEVRCGEHYFWFGVALITMSVAELSEGPIMPPCDDNMNIYLLLEDGRHGKALMTAFGVHIKDEYFEMAFLGLSPHLISRNMRENDK